MKTKLKSIVAIALCAVGLSAFAEEPASNVIWYTATAKLAEITGTGSTAGLHYEVFTDAVGKTLTMTSHTWEETTGKGVITFDGNIATIGTGAFYKTDVTSVTLPECVVTIGKRAFNGCKSLTSVTLPESVTAIGDYAFNDNSKLTSIKLAEGLESIGSSAFQKTGLTSVDIPKSVTTIGRSAFNCDNLSTLKVHWPEGPDASTDMNTAVKSRVKSPEYWFPAGSWKQNATIGLLTASFIHYLTFRQDPNTPTDYYATFFTNLQTSRDKYCYDLTLTDIKAYTGVLEPTDDPDVDALKLKEAGNIIGNGIAVVLKYTAGDDLGPTIDIAIPATSEMPQAVEKNDLKGTDINLSWNGEGERLIPANTYALSSSKEYGVGFYYSNYEGWTIAAHKAYLTLSDPYYAKAFIFQFDGEPTGIKDVQGSMFNVQGSVYNLNGVRVNENYKGIVIKNGKKFYQK